MLLAVGFVVLLIAILQVVDIWRKEHERSRELNVAMLTLEFANRCKNALMRVAQEELISYCTAFVFNEPLATLDGLQVSVEKLRSTDQTIFLMSLTPEEGSFIRIRGTLYNTPFDHRIHILNERALEDVMNGWRAVFRERVKVPHEKFVGYYRYG